MRDAGLGAATARVEEEAEQATKPAPRPMAATAGAEPEERAPWRLDEARIREIESETAQAQAILARYFDGDKTT